ncbi:MAG TPA: hypothetical protein VFL82_10675, partial [Thermomicrobiales bacterium]|nr:hypothetical protein [Thermomicrobiales bacterium]
MIIEPSPAHTERPSDWTPARAVEKGTLKVRRLRGLTPYLPMWQRQQEFAAARARGAVGDQLLLLEHPHVFTNGRHGDRRHLLADETTLAQIGASYHEV